MSLQLIAKQMEAKGRKGDSMLVHMTADEVAGLQKLAESAGGSLTVNPDTGLVEANFLKRMLPTLVGLGLAATGVGMPLAIAGGALTGGIQAKRNDQDFLTGAVMGGLGAYGGASLAGGLGAAAAAPTAGGASATGASSATAANITPSAVPAPAASVTKDVMIGANPSAVAPEMSASVVPPPDFATQYGLNSGTAAPTTVSGNLAQAGEGIGRLADTQGRAAFGEQFGMKQAMAGMAPMMMPEAYKPEEDKLEEDNERYVYDYDPGRTYAERGGGTSAERQYFADQRFKNRRTERVAQGGLLSLAEGGETAAPAEGMSGASAAAFDYLMGRSPSSTGQAAPAMMTSQAAPTTQTTTASADREFLFDPATGMFSKNPNYVDPAAASSGGKERRFSGFSTLYSPFGQEGLSLDPGGFGSSHSGGGSGFGSWGSAGGAAQGGLIGLAKGGMASGGFVVPADVVSALGNGSTDAGLRSLNAMLGQIKPIKGKGDGLSDSIPTNIDGKQPARVADGEAYIDPKTVKRVGGAKKLYAMMDKVRAQAHGKTSQQRKVNPAKVMA